MLLPIVWDHPVQLVVCESVYLSVCMSVLCSCANFEQNDLWSRYFIWHDGSPWPTYIKFVDKALRKKRYFTIGWKWKLNCENQFPETCPESNITVIVVRATVSKVFFYFFLTIIDSNMTLFAQHRRRGWTRTEEERARSLFYIMFIAHFTRPSTPPRDYDNH